MATIAEIIERLKQPIERKLISQKEMKSKKTGDISYIDYIAWFDLCNLLDVRVGLGNWEFNVINSHTTNTHIFVTATLTLHGSDGSRTYTSMGNELLNCSSYGDSSSNAIAQALRKSCGLVGLGRYLWSKKSTYSQPMKTTPAKADYSVGKKNKEITKEQWLALKQNSN